jgi:tRNA-modifying protein YgfZ
MLSIEEGYEAALAGGVWVARPPALRLIRLTGPQRIWFLQNTITADVDDMPSGTWVRSCFLDPKGRVLATFRTGVLDEEVWLDVEPPGADGLVDWFVKYRFRTKVEIEETPSSCRTVLGAASKPGELEMKDGLPTFGDALGALAIADVHGDTAIGELPEAPAELYDILRIEAAIGVFGIDYDTRTLPQEAGLTRYVSVEKGCYVGQETIARIHFRGHVNRVLRPLTFEGIDEPTGCELTFEGASVGNVTSAVRSPRKGVVGIGMVRVEPPEGAQLDVDGGGTAILGPVPEGTKVKTE